MNNPLISIIIPAYNCEKTITVAIKSMLDQTYRNIEVIVVNDGSSDKTADVVRNLMSSDTRLSLVEGVNDPFRFDKKLNRNVNAGYSARNIGFANARGQLITFQDADDASLLNRLDVQYSLLEKYKAMHVTLDWFQFHEKYLGKQLDISKYNLKYDAGQTDQKMIGPEELYAMSQRSKGFIAKISKVLNKTVPFHMKRLRIINKLFFGSLENYPGASNSPLFKREVIDRVQFRSLTNRVWPSFMGRGADKDFNFQVAETFKNSYMFHIPLYMWRVKDQNPEYVEKIDGLLVT